MRATFGAGSLSELAEEAAADCEDADSDGAETGIIRNKRKY